MKHYAPNICLPLKITWKQDCFTQQNAKSEREITQPNIYKILSKVNQVIYTLDTMCMLGFPAAWKRGKGAFRKRAHGARWVIRKGHILCARVRDMRKRQKGYFQYNVEKHYYIYWYR